MASHAYRREAGFSLFKMMFWLALIGFVLLNGALIAQAYYNNSKAQDIFESLADAMPKADASAVQAKMDVLFRLQYIARDDFPDAFYDELIINATGYGLEISSLYDVTIWPIGQVEGVDAAGAYEVDDLVGMDLYKHKFRIDLRFEPYAVSATSDQ